ncbi:MAG: DNA replication/repair protein RecF [Armatimonadota bacterium]|nr:MAG: DNA replication/repair protein RecF [Armatimonadota bacterium]
MKLETVRLWNFRSYRELELTLGARWVLLIGANAQGKTNLLEAIALACLGRSPRRASDVEVIRWGQDSARATARLTTEVRGDLELEATLTPKGRQIKINGTTRRLADLIGLVGLVLFTVDDLDVVKRDPSARRRFVDAELGALSRSYYWNLVRYRRVVDQRNRLLKEIRDGSRPPGELASWDEQLAGFGAVVVEKRAAFLSAVAAEGDQAYRKLTGMADALELRYRPALGEEDAWPGITSGAPDAQELRRRVRDRLARALTEGRGKETEFGITLSGPHRDDFEIVGGAVDLRRFGSQGEQRTAAIALRLGLLAVVAQTVGEPPVLLLDDVLSELDSERRAGLFETLGSAGQTIVAATDVESVPPGVRAAAMTLRVAGGSVTPMG